jgi:hypothetical protein
MTDFKTTRQRERTSARNRLDLLEEISRDVVIFALGTTAIPFDNTSTWYEQTDTRCVMTGPTENDDEQDFASLATSGTVNTMSLKRGKYKITLAVTVSNDHASAAMDYRFGITDDEATAVAFYKSSSINVSLPAASTGFTVPVNKTVLIELTDEDNIIYYCQALDAATGQTASLVIGVSSEVIVERLG